MTLTRRNLVLGMGGTCALLAAILVYLVVAPLPDLEVPQQPLTPTKRAALETVSITVPSPEAFDDINARPIFSADRKPLVQAAGAATSGNPPNVTLVGVILDSQDKIAMVRTPGQPYAGAFHLGADVSGWRLSEIAADHIVLSAGPARDEIRLENNHAAKPGTPPAPPMAAQ